MKLILFLFLFMPGFMIAQINTRAYEIMQRQKYYKTGDWSSWLQRESASYRYHWGLNPLEDTYSDMMDVTFEIRNDDTKAGWWEITILKCNSDEVLSTYTKFFQLDSGELKTLEYLVPNCGTQDAPRLHYQIRRKYAID